MKMRSMSSAPLPAPVRGGLLFLTALLALWLVATAVSAQPLG